MGDFEVDTRVSGEAGRYHATLSRDWEIWGPNGGYVAAIGLRAAGREARIPRPASFSGHFLSVAKFEPVDIDVTTLRQGRRSESLRVSITQSGRPVFEGLLRTASEGPGLEHAYGDPPDVPDPETLQRMEDLRDPEWPVYAFWDNLEARTVWPERFGEPPTAHPPIWHEWYRFRPRATFDDPFVDAGRSLLLIDTMSWPAACRPHPESPFLAPNMDVTAWFHTADPDGEWLLADHECHVAAHGLMGTTGRIWNQRRELLASGGAQLMCIPAPPRD